MLQWNHGYNAPKGQSTPWGKSHSIDKVAPGIAFVETPRHGGYRVSKSLAENEIPRVQLERAAIFDGRYYWFEEDCAWAIVHLNFPQYFKGRVSYLGEPMADVAIRAINRWYPELVQS